MKSFKLYLYGLVTRWIPETKGFALKRGLLRWCGAKIGKNVRINSSARILGVGGLEIGDDSYINVGCIIYAAGGSSIRIGRNCDLAPRVTIVTGSHEISTDKEGHIAGRGVAKSIEIGDGSWLCANSTILSGVMLASQTIVAAGAVVIKSCDAPRSLLAGVPAGVKKQV